MSSNDVVAILLLFITMLFWGATPLLEKMGLKEVEPLTGILSEAVPLPLRCL